MKKSIIAIFCIIAVTMLLLAVMISRSDVGNKVVFKASRNYAALQLIPQDTFHFPALPTYLCYWDNALYAMLHPEGILYRYNTSTRKADTVLFTRNTFTEMPSSLDKANGTIYYFLTNAKQCYTYAEKADSFSYREMFLMRACKSDTDSLFYIQQHHKEKNQTTLDVTDFHTNKTLYTFPSFNDGGLSADGYFVKQEKGSKIFFVQAKNSQVIQYDPLTQKTAIITTIDQTPPANTTVKQGTKFSISSKTTFINIMAVADEQYLYVLSNATAANDEAIRYAIDVYSIADGKYHTSLKIPKGGATLFEKAGDTLYIAYENEIIQYKLTNL